MIRESSLSCSITEGINVKKLEIDNIEENRRKKIYIEPQLQIMGKMNAIIQDGSGKGSSNPDFDSDSNTEQPE